MKSMIKMMGVAVTLAAATLRRQDIMIERKCSFMILCFVLGTAFLFDAHGGRDKPLAIKLPYKVPARETADLSQRIGTPVFIRGTRSIKVMTDETHRSRKNIVAVYVGLPVVDTAQDKVVIEKIQSKKAKPENMALSADGGTLWVEYMDVEAGFEDEIQMTYSLEIYERKARLTGFKPYKTQVYPFKRFTHPPFYHGYKPRPSDDKYFTFLYEAGVSPKMDPITIAKTIYDYLHKEFAYGRPSEMLGGGRPNCATYTAYFAIMCGNAGVPARRCAGFAFGPSADNAQATNVAGHNWAEFYVEGIGWIPVDPTMGDKTDARKQYYLGGLDNGRLCVSKWGHNDCLPLRYMNPANKKWIFTSDAAEFKPFKKPTAIQGVHLFQYTLDGKPVKIKTSDPYGPSLTITEREGRISKTLDMVELAIEPTDERVDNSGETP